MKKNKYDAHEKEEFFALLENQPYTKILSQLLVANRMFMSMMEGVIITDITGAIRFMNPAYSKITGYGEELFGLNPRVLQSGRHDKNFYREMWKSIIQEGQWRGEIWNRRKNGELYIQSTTISRINDDFGKPIYYASVLTDITELKIEEQRLHTDLLLAKEVQKGALSKPINDEQIHIEGMYIPSEMLGGDMYTWYKIDAHRYGVFLMDVMGHGVASALVCMSVRSLLRGIIMKCQDPDLVLQELNNHIYSLFHEEESLQIKKYYLTSIYALIDTKDKVIKYASAGHPPGFLIHTDGQTVELDEGTIPLGLLQDLDITVGVQHYTSKQSKMLFYTDGLINNEQLSTRENIDFLKNILIEHQSKNTDKWLSQVMSELLANNKTSKFRDDATMVAITFY